MFMRLCSDYSDVIRALRDRTDELQISRGSIDTIAGLSDGYSAKLLSEHPSKVLGPMSMGATLETLGLRLMLVEDTAATARTMKLRTPVTASHQRFGNKSNSRKTEKVESVTYAAHGPVSPSAPISHLRIVQSKRGGKYG
jgi:hypothetical protein